MQQPFFESETDSIYATRKHLVDSLWFPFIMVAVIWLIQIYKELVGFNPSMYGIMPWRIWGIRGIFTGPLVHGSWSHLFSNTVPLLVLSFISMYFYRKVAMRAFWTIYILTGVLVWLLPLRSFWPFSIPSISHIGISGVIYGLVSFIFWNGLFRRSIRSIVLASIVMLLYSGMFIGVLPEKEEISWESHLLGSFAGIFTAFWFRSTLEDEEAKDLERRLAPDEAEEPEIFYLPRGTFEMTKSERIAAENARLAAEEAQRRDNFFPPFWNQTSAW